MRYTTVSHLTYIFFAFIFQDCVIITCISLILIRYSCLKSSSSLITSSRKQALTGVLQNNPNLCHLRERWLCAVPWEPKSFAGQPLNYFKRPCGDRKGSFFSRSLTFCMSQQIWRLISSLEENHLPVCRIDIKFQGFRRRCPMHGCRLFSKLSI